jgi:hypothetical protein
MRKAIIYTLISVMSWVTMGCASHPNNMQPKHHSSLAFKGEECADLEIRLEDANTEILALNDDLEQLYINDIWQFWTGMLLLWPALFFLEFGDWSEADRYKELLGERDALEKAYAKCD